MVDLKNLAAEPAANVPLANARRALADWVVPFNNLTLLWGNLGLTGLLMAAGDFLRPICKVFPWVALGCLVLLLFCLAVRLEFIQAGWAKRVVALVTRPGARVLLVLMLLASLTVSAYGRLASTPAAGGERGVLADHFGAVRALQDTLLSLNRGVAQANAKLDIVVAADAARQVAIAADPASLAVVSLAVAGVGKDAVELRAAVFLNAKLAPGQASFHVKTTAADGRTASQDLSAALASAGGDTQLALRVPASTRHLTLCIGAPYPDAAHAHAMQARYDLEPANGGSVAQKGPAALVAREESACGA